MPETEVIVINKQDGVENIKIFRILLVLSRKTCKMV